MTAGGPTDGRPPAQPDPMWDAMLRKIDEMRRLGFSVVQVSLVDAKGTRVFNLLDEGHPERFHHGVVNSMAETIHARFREGRVPYINDTTH